MICPNCEQQVFCPACGGNLGGCTTVPDAAILGWLNPDTGKTCSVDEKHSMEKHQGMPGLHIAKGFRIPLIAAYGVLVPDGSRTE